jgi:hypothetical protein
MVPTKTLLRGTQSDLCVNFGQFRCSWIRMRIAPIRLRMQDSQINADPDPQHCCKIKTKSTQETQLGKYLARPR